MFEEYTVYGKKRIWEIFYTLTVAFLAFWVYSLVSIVLSHCFYETS